MIQTNETKYTAQMYNDLLRRKDALEAENKRLREALRPFAYAYENPDDEDPFDGSDLRRAAEAMKGGAE